MSITAYINEVNAIPKLKDGEEKRLLNEYRALRDELDELLLINPISYRIIVHLIEQGLNQCLIQPLVDSSFINEFVRNTNKGIITGQMANWVKSLQFDIETMKMLQKRVREAYKAPVINFGSVRINTSETQTRITELDQQTEQLVATIARHNLRLVPPIAKKYSRMDVNRTLDLIQTGNAALFKAIKKDKGKSSFAHFARFVIEQSINQNTSLGIVSSPSFRLKRLNKIGDEFRQTHSREVKPEDLSSESGFDPDSIDRLYKAMLIPLPLAIKDDVDGSTIEDVENQNQREPIDDSIEREQWESIEEMLSGLSDRSRQIFKQRVFGIVTEPINPADDKREMARQTFMRVLRVVGKAVRMRKQRQFIQLEVPI